MNEEWKKISNYENYSVSNTGKIRNDKTGRILKQSMQTCGYSVVTLSKNGKIKTHTVHRLVMNTFNPNPDPEKYTDINHIDYNKFNNDINNLEWTTHKYNVKWGSAKNINSIAEEIKNSVINVLQKYISEDNDNVNNLSYVER